MKLNRLKRKAARHVLSTAALHLSTTQALLVRQLLDKREVMGGWGEDCFTPAERAWLDKFCTHLHEDSNTLLRFSHRMSR